MEMLRCARFLFLGFGQFMVVLFFILLSHRTVLTAFCQYSNRKLMINETFFNNECYECTCLDTLELKCDFEKSMNNCNIQLESAKFITNSVILVNFADRNLFKDYPLIEISNDTVNWIFAPMLPGGYLINLPEVSKLYLRLKGDKTMLTVENTEFQQPKSSNQYETLTKLSNSATHTCTIDNITIPLNEYYNHNCEKLCYCHKSGPICSELNCPILSNLELIDPNCLKWDPLPENFTSKVPNCCPEDVICVNNGSCLYNEFYVENWEDFPENITGCENKCECASGKVDCRQVCPPIQIDFDTTLNCSHNKLVIRKIVEDPCCVRWTCPKSDKDYLKIERADVIGDTYIYLMVNIPEGIMELNGYIKIFYKTLTKERFDNKTSFMTTENRVFQNTSFAYKLDDLDTNTEYEIKLELYLLNFNTTLESNRLKIKTELASIQFDTDLKSINMNTTWAQISWRTLSDYDLQLFIGVKLQFRVTNTSQFLQTQLIENRNSFVLDNLKPDTEYEVQLLLIPNSGHDSIAEKNKLVFKTLKSPEINTMFTEDQNRSQAFTYIIICAISVTIVFLAYKCIKSNKKYTATITVPDTATSSTILSTPHQQYNRSPSNFSFTSSYKVEFHKNN